MARNDTASLEFITLLIQLLEKDGLVSKELITSISQELSSSYANQERIPADVFFLIWGKIEKVNSDQNLGLHLGIRSLDFPGQFIFSIMHNSANVREGIENFCRYHNVMNDMFNPVFNLSPPIATLSVSCSSAKGNQYRHIIEALLAMYYLLLKKISENTLKFKEIHFAHSQPDDISEHKKLFSAPLLFDRKENKIVFHSKYLNRPIFFANPNVLKALENYAQTRQQHYFFSPDWSGKVIRLLLNLFPGIKPDIKSVARNLAISTRALQFKLNEEGVTFKFLLTKVRRELASKYLTNTDLSIFEIACLLGYADQSTFNRSFKQWTGLSPRKYRLRNMKNHHKIVVSNIEPVQSKTN